MEAKHIPGPAAEAIANAEAHLNDAALPGYTALAEHHAEMLHALQTLVARYEKDGIPNDSLPAVNAARAALFKVTGEQQ